MPSQQSLECYVTADVLVEEHEETVSRGARVGGPRRTLGTGPPLTQLQWAQQLTESYQLQLLRSELQFWRGNLIKGRLPDRLLPQVRSPQETGT